MLPEKVTGPSARVVRGNYVLPRAPMKGSLLMIVVVLRLFGPSSKATHPFRRTATGAVFRCLWTTHSVVDLGGAGLAPLVSGVVSRLGGIIALMWITPRGE